MYVKLREKLTAKELKYLSSSSKWILFRLILLSISLSWSISGLFYFVFSASSLAIMAAWELLS